MTSILKVNQIQNTAGTTALTVDSSGRVTLPNRPHAMVDFGGSAYVSKSAGIIALDNAVINVGNHYDTTAYKFTCPVSGLYRVEFAGLTQNNADDYEIDIMVDNAITFRHYTLGRVLNFSSTVNCTAGQLLHVTLSEARVFYEGSGINRYTYAAYTFIG